VLILTIRVLIIQGRELVELDSARTDSSECSSQQVTKVNEVKRERNTGAEVGYVTIKFLRCPICFPNPLLTALLYESCLFNSRYCSGSEWFSKCACVVTI